MRAILAIAAAAALTSAVPASAQTNLDLALRTPVGFADALRMTCAQAQAFVNRVGKAGLNQGNFTAYLVKDQRFCLPREGTRVNYVQTRDMEYCAAGYECRGDDRSRFR